MIIDLHTHTSPRSDDSFIKPAELIEQAKRVGLDSVCITEHDWFWKKDEITRLSQEHNFLILPGVETNTDDGHFLVYGLEEYRFGMHHTSFLRKVVDEVGGFMILAHPFRRNYHSGDDIQERVSRYCHKPMFQYVDTIEILNGRASKQQNQFSRELCRKLNLKGTGASDAHKISDIPSYATYFEREIRNVEDLITELKAGRFQPVDMQKRC